MRLPSSSIVREPRRTSPGPWTSHDTEEGEWVVDLGPRDLARVDLDATITRLYFGDMETNTGRDIANADLVAAAPDLLAAAVAVQGNYGPECQDPTWPDLDTALAMLRTAIARATGESA